VLDAVASRPALSWLQRGVSLDSVSGNVVRLAQRGSQRFLPASQKQQIEDLIGSLLGRRVTVEIVAARGPAPSPGADAGSSPPPGPGRETSPTAAARRNDYTASHRESAMNLPLVRQVFDVFGDATLLNVRPESEVEAEKQAAQRQDNADPSSVQPDDDDMMPMEEPDGDV
jgi:hypothetical protein